MALVITPEANIPLPFDTTPDEVREFVDRARAAVNTIKTLEAAGAKIEVTDEDKFESHKLFTGAKSLVVNTESPGAIIHLESLLTEYDKGLINAAHRLRNYVTNRLLEESNNADPKIKIKALELLGKIGDVGLFTERIEVTHTIKSSKEIEEQIMQRLEKYMGDVEVVPDEKVKLQRLEEELQEAQMVEDELREQEANPFVPNEFSIDDLKNEI
jgi:hypothetical protein